MADAGRDARSIQESDLLNEPQKPQTSFYLLGNNLDNTPSPLSQPRWVSNLPTTSHIEFFKATDWSSTPLGPLESWGTALRLYTQTVLTNSEPSCLYWGKTRIAVYNEAFAPLAGKAHPGLMGAPFEVGFREIWHQIRILFDSAEESGLAVDVNEFQLIVERNGFTEETYFTGNFNPVRSDSGKVEGFINCTHEVTRQILSDRRTAMLNSMRVPTGLHHGSLASYVMPFLVSNKLDITMSLFYEVDEETIPGTYQLRLRGQIGVPHGHRLAPDNVDLYSSNGIIPLLRKARAEIITVPADDLFEGVNWQGFGEPSQNISILPLSSAGRLFGFLVVGANPRRPINNDHHQFMRDLSSKVSSIAASIITVEEAKQRAERLEKELADSEKQIRFMAQNASVGMLHSSIDGTMLWANEEYYKLTGHTGDDEVYNRASFLDVYVQEDHPKARDAWLRLLSGVPSVSIELRLKKLFTPPTGDPEPSCILSHSFPYVENGVVKSVMTCMSDISALKWAERTEARKALAAAEAKEQEDFIDTVSHEMRNPLSGILMSADIIAKSLTEVQSKAVTVDTLKDALENNVAKAKIILKCAKHQKRIVDDVLKLSKLEYQLLSITPCPMQVPEIVKSSLEMFESDLVANGVKTSITAQSSIFENHIDWVSCDSSRLTQILTNFLTNAIKFTKGKGVREIHVIYGGVTSNPRSAFPAEIHWAPSESKASPIMFSRKADLGQQVFLTFMVKDTGIGMTPEEMQRLFSRFEQASAKTSIKHGGSGLGLFISKKLTEKLGGEIGVASRPGEGSTFVFYVKSQRTVAESAIRESPGHRMTLSRSFSNPIDNDFTPAADLHHMYVLLAEDNEINQKILAAQLTKAGCIVEVANNGLEALDRIKESDAWHEKEKGGKRLDIILMDWEMPLMDGLECARNIRNLEQAKQLTRHIEIIATTGNARDEQADTALASGIDAVISKPFAVSDLLKMMRERLSITDARLRASRTWSSP
ncbi:hypothetical protein G7Y89_g4572 [Cudoniella acicularis]|uniref:histidine kinase n=1 Tax=Cudoniella acicularis TaxID=354080 RepID=A0A8H4W4U3_9HELO|nr:hypothetical protein G7Y89_g4572 [Cudoniella acicularis]